MSNLNTLSAEHRENDLYSPIEQVSGRVKSVSSILEKMQRKHIPMERMEEEVEDIAGIRIICQFEEDIETVASLIQNRSDMTIKSEKNYLKHIKQSGYRSLSSDHLLYSGDIKWSRKAAGGDSDPYHGHEFLGNDRAFPSVQIQRGHAAACGRASEQCRGCDYFAGSGNVFCAR